ncbi:hypothetical protein ACNQO8_12495 [Acinetobacter calcoaceticus]|uniref:hypothetical protein n=1 Tax=Acinetobacter calcoaceticus TaxID=471 RepID=UPI0003A0EE9B|nr:hypothetical protein M211_0464 [Acinetobacter lactucae]
MFRCDISKYQDYPQTIKLIILRSRDENELLVCPAYSSKTSSATPDAAPRARIKILSAF